MPWARRTAAIKCGGQWKRRQLFDGGVDWEGTFIDPSGPNILIDLPPAIKNFPDYAASNFNPNSQAALARGPRRVQLAAASQPVCTQGRRDLAEPWRFTLGQLRRPVRALNNPSDKAEEGSGDSSSFFELVLAPLHQPKVKLQRALERQSGHLPERKTPPERGQCAHLGT